MNTAITNTVSHRYIIFALADYLIALPTENIVKIVPTPPPNQGGMVDMGLVQLAQYSIQLLDLCALLGLEEPTQDERSFAPELNLPTNNSAHLASPFLIVMKAIDQESSNAEHDLWGITVSHPLDIVSIADDDLNAVPETTRVPGTLQWVSHVATCDVIRDHLSDIATEEPRTLLRLELSTLLTVQRAFVESIHEDTFLIEPPLNSKFSDKSIDIELSSDNTLF